MEAKELRIWNYYLSTKFKQNIICSIEDFYELYARCDGAELDEEIIAEIFKPIPLTEEWLTKLGFNKDQQTGDFQTEYIVQINERFIILNRENGYFYIDAINHEIQYVHQLQNLFFALTGEELTIKE